MERAGRPGRRGPARTLLDIDELQANAILDMQLRRLAALERQRIIDTLAEFERTIADLEDIFGFVVPGLLIGAFLWRPQGDLPGGRALVRQYEEAVGVAVEDLGRALEGRDLEAARRVERGLRDVSAAFGGAEWVIQRDRS